MKLKIQIDNRERFLTPILERLNGLKTEPLSIEVVTLPLGDMVICGDSDGDDKIRLLFERKTVADLQASIKDGRYEEQSFRLQGWEEVPNSHIVYLIEGPILSSFSHRPLSSLESMTYSALLSLSYYKGFSVQRTFSLEETAILLLQWADKLAREEAKGEKIPYATTTTTTTATTASEQPYVSVIKKVKKDNITGANIGEIMLSQIPGVSSVIAGELMKVYRTLPSLILALKENPTALQGFSYTTKDGKTKKLNKTVLATVATYLVE